MKKVGSFLGLAAFVALLLAGVSKLLLALSINLGSISTIISLVSDIALVFTVVVAAYPFAKQQKGSAWMIIYWVLTAFAVFGVVFYGTKLF